MPKLTRPTLIKAAAAVILVLAGLGFAAYQHVLNRPFLTPDVLAEKRAQAAAQNETAFRVPAQQPTARPPADARRNIYFGDLHVHSRLSFDSYIAGNRLSLDEAYRFAKGEALTGRAGEVMQLAQPLDFAAVTDHAEGFGLHEGCALADKIPATQELCDKFERPNAGFFLELREGGERRPMQRLPIGTPAQIDRLTKSTWAHVQAVAERHNEAGVFTSFIAYEYSPPLPDRGKIHRNIIFKNAAVPDYAASAFDAATELELWDYLTENCQALCAALSIPHNPNKSWGLAFAGVTIDGDIYDRADWAVRRKLEPLVEMFQIKGASECAIGINTNDEECAFEQFLPPCPEATLGRDTSCIHPTSMARDGLKAGLLMEKQGGTNLLDFGLIGSTDTHNSNPGDAEEWDYRGSSGAGTAPAKQRIASFGQRGRMLLERNPGGLAAVWAVENTREALFAAMQRREVYATSGTRIRLRLHAGFADMQAALAAADPIAEADRRGVPMGGRLTAAAGRPGFLAWALRDPQAAALDKLQIIKAWTDGATVREQVIDIACSDGRVPNDAGRCPTLQAPVDLAGCEPDAGKGADELKTVWTDADYDAAEPAFYYLRAIEIPSCRWSTYDALRLDMPPPALVPPTVRERAWSSPIWISPDAAFSGGQ